MGLLEDFGYDPEDNTSYSPDEQPDPKTANTDVSAVRRSDTDLPTAIIQTAKQIGINPVDLATAISYETGGTFNPHMLGPETKNGQGRGIGLLQFMSNGAAKDYGITQDSSISDQLAATGRYLRDRGVKAGMGLLDIYSAINAGRVGLYDRSDANNGGAPGTVRDKVEKQMSGHRINAAKLLGFQKFETPTSAEIDAAPSPQYPGYKPPTGPRRTGSSDGIAYVSDNNGGWRVAEPDEVPQAMFYGPPRNHPRAIPAYIRSGTPGLQAGYVPPEMRGPFRKQIQRTGVGTVGTPTTDDVLNTNDYVSADSDLPGLSPAEGTPINEQLAALLSKPIQTEPTPAILDESAGLNLSRTAPNISVPSQDPNHIPVPENTVNPDAVQPTPVAKVALNLPPVAPAPPPAVPISTDNLDKTGLPTEPAPTQPEPASFMDMLEGATTVAKDTLQGGKEFASKVAGNLSGYPFELAAGVRAAVPSFSGIDRKASAGNLLHEGENMRKGADFAFGVSPTGDTLFQKAAALAGRNLTPMGAQTATATGLMAAADVASQAIGTANAKPLMTKEEADKLLFPGVGNNLIGPQLPPHNMSLTQTVMTSAGPYKLDGANYKLLGVMGAVTIGSVLVPAIAKKIINTSLTSRVGRSIDGGVEAFSNRMDLLRTYDDKNAGLMRILKGIGASPQTLDNVNTKLDFETGSSTRNFGNAAIITGNMKSPNHSYKVSVPIAELAKAETDDVTRYMHLWHTWDQIRELDRIALLKTPQSAYGGNASMPSPGPSVVRGMTKSQVNAEIAAMEASPQGQMLKDWRAGYKENSNELLRVESTGEYATKSSDLVKEIRTRRSNEIYQKDLDIENTDAGMARASTTFEPALQERLRLRFENEAKGTYIDEAVAHEPDFARQVTAAEFKKNEKSWSDKAVIFYRRGKKEIWITDPLVAATLKMDPYSTKNVVVNAITGTRKVMEKTTTGALAPYFALTNLQRNYQLAKVSPEHGFASPSIYGTAKAIPEQLYPQMAKFFSEKFEDWSNGWFGRTIGQQNLHGLSLKLAQVHDQSMYLQLMNHGGVHSSMFLDYNKQASTKITQALQSAPVSAARTVLHGLKNLFDAAHNAPNFAYATKNIKKGKTVGEAARSARQLTGDPQKMGQFMTGNGKMIPFEDKDTLLSKAMTKGVQAVGLATEFGRTAVPWWNVTTQGMKRVGKAYLDNPAKFVTRAYLYNVLPAGAVYMYNRGLGTDPNGISYTDYQMNRRSGYNSFMQIYIGIPGHPAEDGITISLPHELATIHAMTAAALHHLTGSEVMNRADDFMRTAAALVGKDWQPSQDVPLRSATDDFWLTMKKLGQIGFIPATPPIAGAIAGSLGYVTPNGPFGGAYQRRDEAYDAQQGMNTSFELVLRALSGGLGDIFGSSYAAYTHSPDAISGLWAAAKAGVRREVEKAPGLRDVVGWRPPLSGSTDVTEEMFSDKGILSKLDQYYTRYDPTVDHTGKKEKGSVEGRLVADLFMPPAPPKDNFGPFTPPPVNALYMTFMKELDRRLKKDTVSDRGEGKLPSGGIGFVSQMDRYSQFTRTLKEIRKFDEGNNVTWPKRLEASPKIKAYLEANHIPLDSPRAARNFLEMQRQTAARQIMFTLKAVEQDFQQRLGDPNFSFEKLDPNQPYLMPNGSPVPTEHDFTPTWPSYAHGLGIDTPHAKSHHKKKTTGTIQLPNTP